MREEALRPFDKFFSRMVLGLPPPLILALAFWWGAIPWAGDRGPVYIALILLGLGAGFALDLTIFRKHLDRLYVLPKWLLALLAAVYSVILFGFFMGFPVFNALVGPAAGYVAARRTRLWEPEARARNTRFAAWASAALTLAFCAAGALLALNEPSICSQLRSMLGLPFEVTMGMVWALILGGGAGLLAAQYGMLRLAEALGYGERSR